MGLDTTHDCWHGPYSAFQRWREAVQVAAGWHLEVVNDSPPYRWPREVNATALTEANFEGEWETVPEDPLIVLVAHSDWSGVIPRDALIPLAERLDGVAERMGATDGQKPESWLAEFGHGARPPRADYDGTRAATLRFAAGLRAAAAADEVVEFH